MLRILLIMLILWAAVLPLHAGETLSRTLTCSTDGDSSDYLLYVPTGYDSTRAYPLLIYLHGRGGNETEGLSGLPYLRTVADGHQWLLVFPAGRTVWDGASFSHNTGYFNSPRMGDCEQEILDLPADISRDYPVDTTRVALMGWSMGGRGSWGIGSRVPDRFIALIPGSAPTCQITGVADAGVITWLREEFGEAWGVYDSIDANWLMGSPRYLLRNLWNTPISVAHGELDTNVPNNLAYGDFMRGHHLLDVPGYSDSIGGVVILDTLAAMWGGYPHQGRWFPTVGHSLSPLWPDAALESLFTQLDSLRLRVPDSVCFMSFDTSHRRNFWLEITRAASADSTVALARVMLDRPARRFLLGADRLAGIRLDLVRLGFPVDLPFEVVCRPGDFGLGGTGTLSLAADWRGRSPRVTHGTETLSVTVDDTLLRVAADFSGSETLRVVPFGMAVASAPAALPVRIRVDRVLGVIGLIGQIGPMGPKEETSAYRWFSVDGRPKPAQPSRTRDGLTWSVRDWPPGVYLLRTPDSVIRVLWPGVLPCR